ncbi:unnamed protein product, partial [Meganyctiphanes norvegica]
MSRKYSQDDKFNNNKSHFESAVAVGKCLFVLILQIADPDIVSFKEKLRNGTSKGGRPKTFNSDEMELLRMGDDFHDYESLDLTMVYRLVQQLCNLESKAPQLHTSLQTLKDYRNDIAHNTDLNKFTDLFIWLKIEELRTLFETTLNGIEHLYKNEVVAKNKEINDRLDEILKSIEVEVTDSEIETFLKELSGVEKCPINVKLKVTNCQSHCSEFMALVERLAKEDTIVKLEVPKAFFGNVDLQFYDSQKYLTPLLDENSKCK